MPAAIPHPDNNKSSLNCAVITVSDTRTVETDKSGQIIQQLLLDEGHQILEYLIVKDEPELIKAKLVNLDANKNLQVIIINDGTGIAPRDTTFDVVSSLLNKTLPGFGEIFRYLSYQEIGSRAISSRAIAGARNEKLIFSLPGSSGAVRLATRELILPEINHLVKQIRGNS